MGHGQCEDMHAASMCHHGVVIWPALLALSEREPLSNRDFWRSDHRLDRRTDRPGAFNATSPASIGLPGLLRRSVLRSPEVALGLTGRCRNQRNGHCRQHIRPEPMAARRRLRMYFHPGFAARNAIAPPSELAEAGARVGNYSGGQAGWSAAFAASGRPPDSIVASAEPGSAVYNEPAPACNFAQTAAQPCCVSRANWTSEDIETVSIRVSDAAARYPGCDPGPISQRAAGQR
jgi:hypothetical protein